MKRKNSEEIEEQNEDEFLRLSAYLVLHGINKIYTHLTLSCRLKDKHEKLVRELSSSQASSSHDNIANLINSL